MSFDYQHSDPARSLALLWRTHERASRKGKPDLSVDRIVHTAMTLADTGGLSALSMRRVADELGVGTMSLYTYVPGKGELIDAMRDTAYGETAGELRGATWRQKLEHLAWANWDLHHRHPWLLQIATGRPVLGPHETAKYERELQAVVDIGLSEIEMDSVLTLVLGHVAETARRSVEATQVQQESGMTDEQWWAAREPLLRQVIDPNRFPTARRVGETVGDAHGAANNPAHAFEFGLHRILDGVELLVQRRT